MWTSIERRNTFAHWSVLWKVCKRKLKTTKHSYLFVLKVNNAWTNRKDLSKAEPAEDGIKWNNGCNKLNYGLLCASFAAHSAVEVFLVLLRTITCVYVRLMQTLMCHSVNTRENIWVRLTVLVHQHSTAVTNENTV